MTEEQRNADEFDLRLYNLICEAEGYGAVPRAAKWLAIRNRLIQARLLVRSMMHEDDLKGTEG